MTLWQSVDTVRYKNAILSDHIFCTCEYFSNGYCYSLFLSISLPRRGKFPESSIDIDCNLCINVINDLFDFNFRQIFFDFSMFSDHQQISRFECLFLSLDKEVFVTVCIVLSAYVFALCWEIGLIYQSSLASFLFYTWK